MKKVELPKTAVLGLSLELYHEQFTDSVMPPFDRFFDTSLTYHQARKIQ